MGLRVRFYIHLIALVGALVFTPNLWAQDSPQKFLKSGMAWIDASALNVRSAPSLSAPSVASFAEGQIVEVLQTRDNWARVRSQGVEGWVSQDYLRMGHSAWVNVSILNVRDKPNPNAEVLYKLVYNQRVLVLNERETWAFVLTDQDEGWVAKQYLRTEYTAWISIPVLNMRKSPSLSAEIITKLSQGQKVDVLDENQHWVKIQVNDQPGWVYKTYLSTEPVMDATVELERRREYLSSNPDLPNVIKSAIQSGSFRIGMNKEQVLASLGKPDNIEKRPGINSQERWIYKNNGTTTTLNFHNDYLSSWSRDIPASQK